ncbi:MAG: tetratricopeptide repeat protein [Myxococcales bacterium]|nr:tetratricopeptide repeat protein [Myxococcales bacterium]
MLLALVALAGCRGREASPPAAPASTASAAPASAAPAAPASAAPAAPAPPPDWRAWLAAEESCADCHPDAVAAWAASPMGQSMATLPPGAPLPPGLPAEVVHPLTQERFTARAVDGRLTIGLTADGVAFERPASVVVGSGAHTQSWFWREGDAFFALPLTWYSQAKRYDVSPGYEHPGHPGFFRAITTECTWCHGSRFLADPVRTDTPSLAIPCARCHGDPRAHVEGRQAGRAVPITMPTALPPAREASVCGYCHLQGLVRLTTEGHDWTDFVPGADLRDSIAIFDRQAARTGVGIVSHAARMAQSPCRQAGGEPLTCTACHHPHGARRDRSAACRDCHQGEQGHACAGPVEDDCVRCHLSRVGTRDIPHTSITDHRIQRVPVALAPDEGDPGGPLLRVGDAAPPGPGSPAATHRLYGRAYVEAARVSNSPDDVRRGLEHLRAGEAPNVPAVYWFDRGSAELMSGDHAAALASLKRAHALGERGPKLLSALASLALRTGDVPAAMGYLADAPPATQADFAFQTTRATLLATVGKADEALAAADAATKARPHDAEAWITRGAVAQAERRFDEAAEAFATATRRRPDQLRGWMSLAQARLQGRHFAEALAAFEGFRSRAPTPELQAVADAGRARALVGLGRLEEAAKLLPEVLARQPVPDAYVALASVALAAGRVEDAGRAIDRVAAQLPDDAELWWIAAEVLARQGLSAESGRARQRAVQLGYPAAPGTAAPAAPTTP